jgi:hypothetical protein
MDRILDDAEWCDADAVPDGPLWPRMEKMPVAGGRYLLHAPRPFDPSPPALAMFRPALSALNGWLEAPSELLRSAIVLCEWERADGAWLRVEAVGVLPLTRIGEGLEPEPARDGLGALGGEAGRRWRCSAGPLHYFELEFEGRVEAWTVCRERDGELVSVLFDERVDHRALTPDQQRHLIGSFHPIS